MKKFNCGSIENFKMFARLLKLKQNYRNIQRVRNFSRLRIKQKSIFDVNESVFNINEYLPRHDNEISFIADSDHIKNMNVNHIVKFYKNGHGQLHNNPEDGPALIHKDGSKYYFKNGRLHNPFGPAVVKSNGINEWWFEGQIINDRDQKVTRTYYNKKYGLEIWKNINGTYHRPMKGVFTGPAKIDWIGKHFYANGRLIKTEKVI